MDCFNRPEPTTIAFPSKEPGLWARSVIDDSLKKLNSRQIRTTILKSNQLTCLAALKAPYNMTTGSYVRSPTEPCTEPCFRANFVFSHAYFEYWIREGGYNAPIHSRFSQHLTSLAKQSFSDPLRWHTWFYPFLPCRVHHSFQNLCFTTNFFVRLFTQFKKICL